MARKNIDRRDYPDPTEPVVDTGPAKSSWARLASVMRGGRALTLTPRINEGRGDEQSP